ncbi:NlpC/P60 family protein [Actinokineospora iranica]|uniref:NlpC/P60 family protein n=1 Tax=Actinokineospora iranica TaxID=1271860 RepID=A0A1G6ZE91_9PSEU|nr:NlpC/P60 family protein [Actinokineospora iranica]SDE00185.1 NlpC/P60 family protein [Actinokineospora iranica]
MQAIRIARGAAFAVTFSLAAWGVLHFATHVGRTVASPAAPAAIVVDDRALAPDSGALTYERLTEPDRTVVRTVAGAVVATFTDGARTAVVTGPRRVFAEPEFTAAQVSTTAWVRLLPGPWHAGDERAEWFGPWLVEARDPAKPDIFAIATEYQHGAPVERDPRGVRFRGDAAFGPVAPSGTGRLEQSDFIDYLGVSWKFGDGVTRKPKPRHYGATDCSGFIRLVFGYRSGYPLLSGNTPGPGLPRRAYAIAEFGPGVALVPDTGARVTDYAALQPGDLLFFHLEGDEQIDHVALYLGIDTAGRHRFMSSRERANGPTMGDLGGTSLLDDNGNYSRSWRAARRV